jgi:hypothetical protein
MTERSIEERFDAQQVIAMAQRLTVREIEALGEATELREKGLRRARAGDFADGRRLIDSARLNTDRVALSDEAARMFETYQRPAESYVDFRQGRFADAAAAMLAAIADANQLRSEYGYIVELRRIHLGANMIRIAATSGDHDAAIRAGLGLARYVIGDREGWPWPALKLADVDPLSVDARLLVLGQVLRPLADAWARRPGSGAAFRTELQSLAKLTSGNRGDVVADTVAQWVAQMQAQTPAEPARKGRARGAGRQGRAMGASARA